MKDIMITEQDWGCIDLNINFDKIDLLPRITISDMKGAFVLNVGFFIFTLNVVVLDKPNRELNKEIRKKRNDTLGKRSSTDS